MNVLMIMVDVAISVTIPLAHILVAVMMDFSWMKISITVLVGAFQSSIFD